MHICKWFARILSGPVDKILCRCTVKSVFFPSCNFYFFFWCCRITIPVSHTYMWHATYICLLLVSFRKRNTVIVYGIKIRIENYSTNQSRYLHRYQRMNIQCHRYSIMLFIGNSACELLVFVQAFPCKRKLVGILCIWKQRIYPKKITPHDFLDIDETIVGLPISTFAETTLLIRLILTSSV